MTNNMLWMYSIWWSWNGPTMVLATDAVSASPLGSLGRWMMASEAQHRLEIGVANAKAS